MGTGWTTRRSGTIGGAGRTGAAIVLGLLAALVAVLATSLLAGPDEGSSTTDGAKTVVAGPATLRPTPSIDTGPGAGIEVTVPARPVLRVDDGSTGLGSTAPPDARPSSSTSTPYSSTIPASTGTSRSASTLPSASPGPSTTSPPPTTAATTTPPARPLTSAPSAGAGGRFVTLPPGSRLPSGAECAGLVRPTPENVPENRTRNQTRGGPVTGTYLSINTAIAANDYEQRIDGDFVGSTDEIIQWAACKWGFDEDLLRAQVFAESSWYAGKLGDCGESTVPETGGCASVGLIQIRSAERSGTHHPGLYPEAWRSSALNLDYGLAVKRLCYEGLETWLGQFGDYRAGDEWNCLGRWFSGRWADAGSIDYQGRVRDILARRPWETGGGCKDWQTNNHCAN